MGDDDPAAPSKREVRGRFKPPFAMDATPICCAALSSNFGFVVKALSMHHVQLVVTIWGHCTCVQIVCCQYRACAQALQALNT